jgi:hypothetical protein
VLDGQEPVGVTGTKKAYTGCPSLVAANDLKREDLPGPMPDLDVVRYGPRHGTFRDAVDLIDDVADLEVCTGEPGDTVGLYDAR